MLLRDFLKGWCGHASIALCSLLVALISRDALAFKVTTHAASANDSLDQLNQVITQDPAQPNTLVFKVKGKTLNVPVTAKEAYLAVINNPDFFRAGVVGPDAFPDLITGQYWQHGNQNVAAQGLVKEATGNQVNPTNHDTTAPSSARVGTSEFRAIDFAMALLGFAKGGTYAFQEGERPQVIAFIMGYIAHGVGDSFAHTWGVWLSS